MSCRNTLPMNATHDAVEASLLWSQYPELLHFSPKITQYFLEVLSFIIMRGNVDMLWGNRSATNLEHRHEYIMLIVRIFDTATRNKSHRDLLCCIARHSAIWSCLMSVFWDKEHNFSTCLEAEINLVMQMIPFINVQTARGLISKTTVIRCLTMLLLHRRSHIVSLTARTLTTLVLGKHRRRVLRQLLANDAMELVMQLLFTMYLLEDESFFQNCTCNVGEFLRLSQHVAMQDVLQVRFNKKNQLS